MMTMYLETQSICITVHPAFVNNNTVQAVRNCSLNAFHCKWIISTVHASDMPVQSKIRTDTYTTAQKRQTCTLCATDQEMQFPEQRFVRR